MSNNEEQYQRRGSSNPIDPKVMMEALTSKLERMLNRKLDGLHDRLDRIKHTQTSSPSPNSHGQGRHRGFNRRHHVDYYGEDVEEEKPMGGYRQHRWNRQAKTRGDDGINGIKMKIPSFQGKSDPAIYLEWEKMTELVFNYRHYTEEQKVILATIEFTDYAEYWWDQLCISRRRNRELPIETWGDLKAILRKRFVPNNYYRDLYQKPQCLTQGTQSVEDDEPNFPKTEDKTQALGDSKPKDQDDAPRMQGKSEVPTVRNRCIECVSCQGVGHVASQCPNKEVMVLRANVEHEIERVDGIDSMPSLVEALDEKECAVSGDLLLAKSCLPPLEDSEGEEHAVQGELLVAIDSQKLCEDTDEEENEEHVAQGELLVASTSTMPLENAVGQELAVQMDLVVARGVLHGQTKEIQLKDFEHHDFLGIEHFLSKCGTKNTITLYEEEHGGLEVYVERKPLAMQIREGEGWQQESIQKKKSDREGEAEEKMRENASIGSANEIKIERKQESFYAKANDLKRTLLFQPPMFVLVYNEGLLNTNKLNGALPSSFVVVLQEFEDDFPDETPHGLPPIRGLEHKIDFMVGRGHVGKSMNSYVVPALLYYNKDWTWKLCVEGINIMLRYHRPISCLVDMLDESHGSCASSKVVLKNGLDHVRIKVGIGWKNVFKAKFGLFEWLVIPYGLINASSSFMRLINLVVSAQDMHLEKDNNIISKFGLLGEFDKSATFNVSDLSPFDVGDDQDLRTNPFQEGGNDENMASNGAWSGDPIQVPKGPITRSQTKAFRMALNGLIKGILDQSCSTRPIDGVWMNQGPTNIIQVIEPKVAKG